MTEQDGSKLQRKGPSKRMLTPSQKYEIGLQGQPCATVTSAPCTGARHDDPQILLVGARSCRS